MKKTNRANNQPYSPAWLREALERASAELRDGATTLLSLPAIGLLLSMVTSLIILAYSIWMVGSESAYKEFRLIDRVFEQSVPFAALLIILTAFWRMVRGKFFSPLTRLVLTSSFILLATVTANGESGDRVLASLALVALTTTFLLFPMIATRNWSPSARIAALSVAAFFVFSARWLNVVFKDVTGETGTFAWLYSPLHLVLFSSIYIMHEVSAMRPKLRMIDSLASLFSPMMLVSVFPIPVHSFPSSDTTIDDAGRRRQSLGVLSVAYGALALGASVLLLRYVRLWALPWLLKGWLIYLGYVLLWIGYSRLSYGCAIAMGYQLQAPTQWAILAANPLDRWKRWNIYFYEWFLVYVYLPVQRRTRSIALAVFCVFALNFVLHNSGLVFHAVWRFDRLWSEAFKILQSEAIFYCLQGAGVYLGFAFRHLWPSEDRVSGWLGVLATHLLMALTHAFVIL